VNSREEITRRYEAREAMRQSQSDNSEGNNDDDKNNNNDDGTGSE